MRKKIVLLLAVTILASAIVINEIYAVSLGNDHVSRGQSQEYPLLPMQMLVVHSQHITMGYVYSFTVKIYDPKQNPDKNILQNYGLIPGVNINATIYQKKGQVYQRFSGITDAKGTYSGSILIPITSVPQTEFYSVFNASKLGYVSQSIVMPFTAFHP